MNNDKTTEKLIKSIMVLDENGRVISSELGVEETAKKIGIDKKILLRLLEYDKPCRVNIINDTGRHRCFTLIKW